MNLKNPMFEDTYNKCREATSKAGGQYLERLGKFDLRTLTKEEWFNFIDTIAHKYEETFKECERIPF